MVYLILILLQLENGSKGGKKEKLLNQKHGLLQYNNKKEEKVEKLFNSISVYFEIIGGLFVSSLEGMEKLFNAISVLFGIIGGLFVSFLGGWDGLIATLVGLALTDYITGVLKAIHNRELSSEIGIKGIIKKVVIFILVGISVLLERNLGIPAIREIVIMFFTANEGISLLENVSQMGIPFPEQLKNVLLQLRDKNNKEER